jgi:hypothetical protein
VAFNRPLGVAVLTTGLHWQQLVDDVGYKISHTATSTIITVSMIVKSFGCSFIFGSDLDDDGTKFKTRNASQHTWPALIAKQLGYQYQCYAKPGIGNLQIANSVLNQIHNHADTLWIIGWTWIDRFDYTNPVNDQWATLMPADTDSGAQYYYRHFHSQYRDKLVSLINVSTVLDALTSVGAKFVMTYTDPLIFETEYHCDAAIQLLQNKIKPSMSQFNGQTFLDFSRNNNFPISERWHPLEAAHQAAAEYMLASQRFR